MYVCMQVTDHHNKNTKAIIDHEKKYNCSDSEVASSDSEDFFIHSDPDYAYSGREEDTEEGQEDAEEIESEGPAEGGKGLEVARSGRKRKVSGGGEAGESKPNEKESDTATESDTAMATNT